MKRLYLRVFLLSCWIAFLAQRNPPPVMPDTSVLHQLIEKEDHAAATGLLRDFLLYDESSADWARYAEHSILIAESLDALQRPDALDSILRHSIHRLTDAGWSDSAIMADLWMWHALNTRKLENYTDALHHYREAIRVYETAGIKGYYTAFCYKNAAQILTRRMDYKTANEYLQAALRNDTDGDMTQSILSQIANNHLWQDSLDAAWKYYQLGAAAPSQGVFYDGSLFSVGASILLKKNRLSEAFSLYGKALDCYRKIAEKQYYIRCYTDMAQIACQQERYAQAENYYREAEKTAREVFKTKTREMAKLYTEWGDFYKNNNNDTRALQLYQQALIQAWPGFDNPDPAANPPLTDAPVELWAMRALARKGQLLLDTPQPDTAARRNAADCFDRALAVAEQLRHTYGKDEAKLYFQQRNFNVQQEAAENLWALAHSGADQRDFYLRRFFNLLENSRAAVLREALAQQKALVLAGIPDSLLQLEENLRRDASAQQNMLAENSDPAKREAMQAVLFQINRRYAELFSHISKTYPPFERFNQASQVTALETVQASLSDKALLLSYFDAGDRYLCVALRKNEKLSAFEIDKDSILEGQLEQFLGVLADRNAQENAPDSMFSQAFFLKNKLLPDQLLTGISSLLVIPDGRLCYLPFEALLTAPHRGSFGQAPWLLRQVDVRYAWSASLAGSTQNRTGGLLHIAPFVREGRDGLAPLTSSSGDVPENIATERITEQSARAAAFIESAQEYGVLHLSTHANGGENPGVEFADRRMSLSEIYAQRYRADLVALSACETNTGLLARGEGVLSLARAFAYAGAQSLVASYWKVSDRSTATLFSEFYRQLNDGKPRSAALRDAKLAYLASKEPDLRKSPWHWAAFTLTGADGPVSLHAGGDWLWLLWGILPLFAAVRLIIRLKKRKMA